jgi:SET domain-containing protein
MTLGYGSVYNHSATPNMKWYAKRSTNEIVFYAIRDIEPGEELTHDYKWDEYPWEKKSLQPARKRVRAA